MEPNRAGKGYAIWLMPEEPVYSESTGVLLSLSRECSMPAFEPHVTLLAGITAPEHETVSLCAKLASVLSSFEVRLTTIDFLEEYYRSIFVRVAETDAIMLANGKAREVFGLRVEAPYLPHLSLLYGDVPLDVKKAIAAELGSPFARSFQASSIHLYSVAGPVSRWRLVRTFDFALS